MSTQTKLDLYNFVEPSANQSEYVLTSPRSLEACSRFNIKPIDLLPKTFEEFCEEVGQYNSELAYKKFEKQRLRNLRVCREERERIIDEEFQKFEEKSSSNEDEVAVREEKREKPSITTFLEKSYTPRREKLPSASPLPSTNGFHVLSGSSEDESEVVPKKRALSRKPLSHKPPALARPKSATFLKENISDLMNGVKDLSINEKSGVSEIAELEREARARQQKRIQKAIGVFQVEEKFRRRDERIKDSQRKKFQLEREKQAKKERELYSKKFRQPLIRTDSMKNMRSDNPQENLAITSARGRTFELKNNNESRGRSKSLNSSRERIRARSLSLSSRHEDDSKRREDHLKYQAELELKHQRAQESFSRRMKEKQMQLVMKKVKEEDRKVQQQRQRELISKDLDKWRSELLHYQNLNTKRTVQSLGKRKAIKSEKLCNSRLIKEFDHASLKARVDEENRLREEELRTAIVLKDKRADHINREKEEFVKMSRDTARAARDDRFIARECNTRCSFDKMVENAQRMGHIEKLGLKQSTPLTLNKKSSGIMFG